MVWGAFGYHGSFKLKMINGCLDGTGYKDMLKEAQLGTKGTEICGNNWVFQQDNAPIHNSGVVRGWMEANHITVMDSPALSPDLDPIENIRGYLTRKVYENGRQFDNIGSLKKTIMEEWDAIPDWYHHQLIDSMKNRIFEVIFNQGGKTKY